MMKDKILARLQDGDSAEEIAKEFSDALNAAEAEFNTVSKETEHKRYLVHQMTVPIKEYIETYFSDDAELVKSMEDFGATDEELDKIAELLDVTLPLLGGKIKIRTNGFNNIFSPFLGRFF